MGYLFENINKLLSIFYQKNKKTELYFVILLIALLIILEIISFSSLVPIISLMINENLIYENEYINKIYNFFEFKNKEDFIFTLAPITLIFFLISTLTSILIIFLQQKFIYRGFQKLSNNIVRKYFNLDYKNLYKIDSPEIIKNNLIPVIAFCEGSLNAIINLYSRTIVMTLFIVFALIIEPIIGIFTIILMFIIYFLIFRTIKNKLRIFGERTELSLKEKTKILNELFIGTREIKIMNLFDIKMKEYNYYDKIFSTNKTNQFVLSNSPKYILELIVVFALIVLIIASFKFNLDPNFFIPRILMISAITYKLLPHTNQLFLSLNILKYQEKIRDIFLKVINYKEEEEDTETKVTFNKTLELKNIKFSYGDKQILNNFNLIIKKNQIISLKGKSGSGKTTITNIISSILKPDSGELIIDDKKITSQNKSLKEKIGFVTQNLFFFSGTLRDNLTLSNKNISEKKIFDLLKKINLYEKFYNSEEKLNFFIKFNGSNLSLGEKQRLAISRCILMERDIIILDEPISSLDKENAKEIKNILSGLKNFITCIIISHIDVFDDISDRIINIDQ